MEPPERDPGMKIEFGKKTAAAFGFVLGYAMLQGVFYGIWDFNGKPWGIPSIAVWLPTMVMATIAAVGSFSVFTGWKLK